ncbi:MAG: hypothetical protein EAZ89_06175 [Bacteroidetes bacterium]|nr:MAG: hypothetical protein EAZ89_06175 [Bacteroidota bacterium]
MKLMLSILSLPGILFLLSLGCAPVQTPSQDPPAAQTALLYVSADTGKTWRPFAQGIPTEATVNGILGMGATVFVATNAHGIFALRGDNTWESRSAGLPDQIKINALTFVDSTLFAASFRQGIFTSADSGKSWQHRESPFDGMSVRALYAFGTVLLAGTDKGVYSSADRGKTWVQASEQAQINGFAHSGKTLYAAASNGALRSEDNGAHWQYIYQPFALHDIARHGQHIFAMTLGDGLLRSDNEGVTWENINEGTDPKNRYTFEVKSIGSALFAAQWEGIYRAAPGGASWSPIAGGLPAHTAFPTLEVTSYGLMAGIGLR